MPTINTINDDKKPVTHYCVHNPRARGDFTMNTSNCYIWFTNYDEIAVEHLRLQRKFVSNRQQELIPIQKAIGRTDPDYARWISQHIKELLKYERAYTIVLQHVEGTNPRNEYRLSHWPVDLAEYLDHARALYDLAATGTFIDNGFQPGDIVSGLCDIID